MDRGPRVAQHVRKRGASCGLIPRQTERRVIQMTCYQNKGVVLPKIHFSLDIYCCLPIVLHQPFHFKDD